MSREFLDEDIEKMKNILKKKRHKKKTNRNTTMVGERRIARSIYKVPKSNRYCKIGANVERAEEYVRNFESYSENKTQIGKLLCAREVDEGQ